MGCWLRDNIMTHKKYVMNVVVCIKFIIEGDRSEKMTRVLIRNKYLTLCCIGYCGLQHFNFIVVCHNTTSVAAIHFPRSTFSSRNF